MSGSITPVAAALPACSDISMHPQTVTNGFPYGEVSAAILQLAQHTRLLICDVDGVFSDGRIYLGNDGEELKAFHTRDGYGVKALQATGVAVAVITGRESRIVSQRMAALGVAHVQQGVDNKGAALDLLLAATGLSAEACAYIGDDLIDWPVMARVGLAVSVADGHPLLRQRADYISYSRGGFGAVREICDLIMFAQGTLESTEGKSI